MKSFSRQAEARVLPASSYGWVILAVSFLIYFIAQGEQQIFGVFLKPLLDEFSWSRATVSAAFSLYMIAHGGLAILTGWLTDRYGPRLIVWACCLLVGLGYYLVSRTEAIWQLYLFYSVVVGIGMAGFWVPLSSLLSRWFVEKRGLALGIFTSGAGIGALIMSPLAQYLILTYGWRTCFIVVAVLVWIVSPLALLLRRAPGQMTSPGKTVAAGARKELALQEASPGAADQDYSLSEALRTSSLWMYTLGMVLFCVGLMMAVVHIVAYAIDLGIAEMTAANALGVMGGVNAMGRLTMGAASDRIGTKRVFYFSFTLSAAMLLWLIGVKNVWMLYVAAIGLGFSWGSTAPQMAKLAAEMFGTKSMGAIFGIIASGAPVGAAIGPVLAGYLFDQTGSYSLAFAIGAISIFMGLGLIFMLRPPGRKGIANR